MKRSIEKREDTTSTAIPESRYAVMPLAALFSWLEGTHHREIIQEGCTNNFAALCKALDQSGIVHQSSIGLEVHHHPRLLTDISIFGGKELLRMPGIVYPDFAFKWYEYLEDPGALEYFPPNLIAEFDHKPNGYEMMGFFQRCSKQEGGLEAVLNAIRMYAQATSISKQDSCDQDALYNPAVDILRQTMGQLGCPDYIGFVGRGKPAIKLIITINEDDLPTAATFLQHQYRAILPSKIGDAEMLERFLRTLFNSHEVVRTSIDLELTKEMLIDRLAFECFPRRSNKSGTSPAPTAHAEEGSSGWDSESLKENFMGYKESLALACKLPYGQKRPAANLIDEELLSLQYTHRKFMLCADSLTVNILLASSTLLVKPEGQADLSL
jgi:hypothetical protein